MTTRLISTMTLLLAAGSAYAAPAGKVDICHRSGNGKTQILNVSSNAVSAHVGHGDHIVGPEACDGIDNDCDGLVDEIAPVASTCGVGACASTGWITCSGGALTDSCAPGAPSAETCDTIDNDCNGQTDDIAPTPSACGLGGCSATGFVSCEAGALIDSCTPGAPSAEVCSDGTDNDCDGQADEDCSSTPPNCVAASYEGHSYLICQGSKNYDQAAAECTGLGMTLAHMDSEGENSLVVTTALYAFGCISYSATSYWVSNLKSETGSSWTSGNPIWASGEPNGDGNHVHLIRYCGQPYGWNDVPTGYQWGWVCESAPDTGMNDLVSEYQEYQDATVEEEGEADEEGGGEGE